MNEHPLVLAGTGVMALPSGGLWLPDQRLLCVSDLHLGKSDRVARRLGLMLPPYEITATLDRLDADLDRWNPATVVCLGDSFDDLDAAASLSADERMRLNRMQAGRDWIWIMGNHDAGPVDLGGSHLAELHLAGLVFRHIALAGARGEVSGHYHPKLALAGAGGARPCFVFDDTRLILPAFGAYTGGLRVQDPALRGLFGPQAIAVLTGRRCLPVPLAAVTADRAAPRTGRRGRSG